jgi:hypothetical protein
LTLITLGYFFQENEKAGNAFAHISGKYVLVFCTAQYGNTKVKDMMGEGGVNGCQWGEMMKTQRSFEFFNTVIKCHGKLMMNVFLSFRIVIYLRYKSPSTAFEMLKVDE